MSSCYDGSFPCQDPKYCEFDKIAAAELAHPLTAHQIVNESVYCTYIPLEVDTVLDEVAYKTYLDGLKGKQGVYQMWIDYEHCTDHSTHTMLCVYVGKGWAAGRIDTHIQSKWPAAAALYVTFYECSNRMSKYIEQLFLDTYAFHLNTNENPGTDHLFGVWSDEDHLLGTELNRVSGMVQPI